MSTDPEAEAAVDNLLASWEAIAGLLIMSVPGMSIESEKLAPLVTLLAGEGRRLHSTGKLRAADETESAPTGPLRIV